MEIILTVRYSLPPECADDPKEIKPHVTELRTVLTVLSGFYDIGIHEECYDAGNESECYPEPYRERSFIMSLKSEDPVSLGFSHILGGIGLIYRPRFLCLDILCRPNL